MKKLIILVLGFLLVMSFVSCSSSESEINKDTLNENANMPNTPTKKGDIKDNISEKTIEETSNKNSKKIKMKLYYANMDNSALPYEEREVDVYDSAVLKAALNALIEGPKTKDLYRAVPENTKVLGINIKENTAIVNLTKDFNNFKGSIDEVVGRTSIVNTLTEFDNIDKVKILIEGEDYIGPSGKPLGALNRVELDEKGYPVSSNNKKTITVYFGNSNADKVVPEKRKINIKEKSIEEIIFDELKKGPTKDGLHPIIPDGTKLISANTKDGICTLNFSSEFVTNHPGGSAGESMTINSIVNSYTELNSIDKVKFLIAGKDNQVFIHVIFNKPYERNEEIIGS